MNQVNGLYRLYTNGPITESTLDLYTNIIGPYKIPYPLPWNPDTANSKATDYVRLYELLLDDPDALIAFDYCSMSYVTVSQNQIRFYPRLTGSTNISRSFDAKYLVSAMKIDMFEPIGWIKTYPKYKEVYQAPYYVLRNINTGELPDFPGVKLDFEPKGGPELQDYKELLSTSHKAVIRTQDDKLFFLD